MTESGKYETGRETNVFEAADEMERCVICGCIVDVKRSTPVSSREHYIEGAGQLCIHCYHSVYPYGR